MNSSKLKIVVLFLVSLLGHLWFFRMFAPAVTPEADDAQTEYLELVSLSPEELIDLSARQVIELPPGPDQRPETARYLAERAMKVEKEMMSKPGVGFFGHSAPPVSSYDFFQEVSPDEPIYQKQLREKIKPSIDDVFFYQNYSQPGFDLRSHIFGGIDFLEGAIIGEITLANAYKFKYADFFNQLKRSIAFYWNPGPGLRLIPLPKNDLVSRIRMVLNENGSLADVEVVSSSGFASIDRAGVNAIKSSVPVFNVPKELLDSNQQLVIICEFRIMFQG